MNCGNKASPPAECDTIGIMEIVLIPLLLHKLSGFVHTFVPVTLPNSLLTNKMAKILTTAIVADIRNKLNGSVFSKNRYGAYVRTKVTPVNPQSTSQMLARNKLTNWSQNWRALNESQRQGWIAAAPNFPTTDIYGNIKILSGQALYVKLNINLANVGASDISDAPSPIGLPTFDSLSLSAAETGPTLSMTFAPTPVAADFAISVFATPNVPPGRSFVKNLYRFIQIVDAAATSPANLLTAYQAVHGNPVADQKIFVKAFFVSKTTGQAGTPMSAMAIVAP